MIDNTTHRARVCGQNSPDFLSRGNGAAVAYRKLPGAAGKSQAQNPLGVVFLPGFMSNMTGTKALAVEALCRSRGLASVRFDYQGHGASTGALAEGTVGSWLEDTLSVIDELTQGPQVLVGSSMGGWIMLLAALARPDRVAGLLGIAAAPDFTEELLESQIGPEAWREIQENGLTTIASEYDEPYVFTKALIDDGKTRLLLPGEIAVACPVRLVHGLDDRSVPWRTALRIQKLLASDDVEVTLVKAADHRLSRDHDIERLLSILAELLDRVVI